ncbi:hypothetical protein BS47DRAFT_1310273 [Hydnum rufescens UP504]|uniref:Phosphodiest-domain-containing protein n=1 Tax=Hydnum rufescens UP504 TaxID=1448309 RepID=A0A9P6AC82_9AGAM|nr:hypothetical protein BS47DRAFT_1310273 [Hydnum rufescens UP504]
MPVAHDVRLSNGTHQFRRTVLMVSIDGLRADYIDRGLTPHLLDISRKGLRAKFMKPVFPTLTFPNHWSLMTGLYAESHGIVANNFYDPVSNSSFHYSDPTIHYNSSWWGGTPIWETVSKAGLISANLMWPGPIKTRNGISPTYFVPWKDHVPLQEKHDKIMEWIDLPFDLRPQLILAYEPHLDQVGHKAGPDSDLVNNVLLEVDEFAASIHASLRERHLENIVDVIFVSDHGMADTSNTRLIYLDDVMGTDHVAEIEHEDGWPSVGLRMSPRANTTEVLARLLSSGPATSDPPAMHVYTAETMPERYHLSARNNERIAPIYIVPRLGWAITNHHEHEVVMQGDYKPKGNHGYDNDEPSMHAAFVADGPFTTLLKRRRRERSSFLLRSLPVWMRRRIAPRWIRDADVDTLRRRGEPQIIEGFENVEVYGLIVKLLGIEPRFAAATNGTVGFWERYLDDDA